MNSAPSPDHVMTSISFCFQNCLKPNVTSEHAV